MSQLLIDTKQLVNPKYYGLIVCTHFSLVNEDSLYQVTFNELPEKLQYYYNYLDVEERKSFMCVADKESGIVMGDWHGDRAILEGDRIVCAPYFYRDNVWMDWSGESIRFMKDLEDRLAGVEE